MGRTVGYRLWKMASKVPLRSTEFLKKVCSLYKRSLRNEENFFPDRCEVRFRAVLMRQDFEKLVSLPDPVKANQILIEKEKTLVKEMHWQPYKFAESIGGNAYGREVDCPDWVMDYWHPLEKAQYPEYFARREQRKKEFVEWWERQYGKPTSDNIHH